MIKMKLSGFMFLNQLRVLYLGKRNMATTKIIFMNLVRLRRLRDAKTAMGNEKILNHDAIPHPQATRKASDTHTTTKLM